MKCCTCKKPCEEVWMFGPFGNVEHLKDKEYCQDCFIPLADKLLPKKEQDIQQEEVEKTAS
jgi:hypothetical protein